MLGLDGEMTVKVHAVSPAVKAAVSQSILFLAKQMEGEAIVSDNGEEDSLVVRVCLPNVEGNIVELVSQFEMVQEVHFQPYGV